MVTNPSVPPPIRDGLNVERGLNEGICIPIHFTLLAVATASGGPGHASLAPTDIAEEIGIGLAVGVYCAFVGALVVRRAARAGWSGEGESGPAKKNGSGVSTGPAQPKESKFGSVSFGSASCRPDSTPIEVPPFPR